MPGSTKETSSRRRGPRSAGAPAEARRRPSARTSFPSRKLLAWYRRYRRVLPWRDDPTPYAVWVSEIMLQQTRIETVVPYFKRFLKRFPTVADLARAPVEDVVALWSGLGYYRRARSLHAGAQRVLREHGGEFPRDLAAALDIPGVGPYTAGAVLSIAYNRPAPVVDGNVERVLSRFFKIPGNPKSSANARSLREKAGALIPRGRASDFNQALMELGALVCTPDAPQCSRCPLARECRAHEDGDQARFPESPPARSTVAVTLETVVLLEGNSCLMERREGEPLLDGLWLFPTMEVPAPGSGATARKTPSRRLVDSVAHKTGLDVSAAVYLGETRHSVTYRRIKVRVFLLRQSRGKTGPGEARGGFSDSPSGVRWIRIEDLGRSVPVSSLVFKVVRMLQDRAGEA